MKIGYFSPLPPKKTGIAAYSAHLLAALREQADIHVMDPTLCPDALPSLGDCDVALYHLGNNPWYHLDIYGVLLREPGIVVLHDTVLYYLVAGLGPGGLAKEFCLNYGLERLREFDQLVADCPDGDLLRYPHPERYPFLRRALAQARAVIVHSHAAEAAVRAAGYRGRVAVIPLLAYPPRERQTSAELGPLRARLGLAAHEIVIGCFGFLDPTKRLISLLRAVDLVRGRWPLKLLIVGEGDEGPVQQEVNRLRLGDLVIRPGFVADEDFVRYLALADIVANLRYPSMGESSATLIQAFALARPCVVTNHAWFSELPDACVWKIRYGEGEVDDLAAALSTLASDPAHRHRLGQQAREYVEQHCTPADVARRYLDVVEDVAGRRDPAPAVPDPGPGVDPDVEDHGEWVRRYLVSRALRAIPTAEGPREP
jgi:glycosyltransferase involved in cell wall biosynthesis